MIRQPGWSPGFRILKPGLRLNQGDKTLCISGVAFKEKADFRKVIDAIRGEV
jgi:hypothetical protein